MSVEAPEPNEKAGARGKEVELLVTKERRCIQAYTFFWVLLFLLFLLFCVFLTQLSLPLRDVARVGAPHTPTNPPRLPRSVKQLLSTKNDEKGKRVTHPEARRLR